MALFKIIESGTSPQQVAANEHLMKCKSRRGQASFELIDSHTVQ